MSTQGHDSGRPPFDFTAYFEREHRVAMRALELHEERCSPEAAHNIREIARSEIEGREPHLQPAVLRGIAPPTSNGGDANG